MYWIHNESTDPAFNLALEQYVFDNLDQRHSYFMLWQNDNAVIVGKHQNTIAEINPTCVKQRGIAVVRRLSGGGAVYHDLGNLNYTFIADAGDQAFDFATFCRPVAQALTQLGVPVEISGRNDMTIDGKKFSGNAQYMKRGRVMHHGTILYDSDLDAVTDALNVPLDKIESKGIKSIKSRMTNIKPHMPEPLPFAAFHNALHASLVAAYDAQPYTLTPADLDAVRRLRDKVYSQWNWNYGASPAYTIRKERRVEGCGKIEVHMDVSQGSITALAFYGDYFGNGDPADLVRLLTNCPLEPAALHSALTGLDISLYFNNLTRDDLISILCE